MTTYTCPKGHASSTDDFCDECGAKIGGTAAFTPPVWKEYGWLVPSVPTVDVEPATVATVTTTSGPVARPATGQWTATVGPDRTYFDANAIEGVEYPADTSTRTVVLPPPQVRIGRKSRSKGTDPELDLSAEPLDPGVSHSHALLTLNIDGVWLVSDLGSTNGTYVNDEAKPLTGGQTRALKDGDRVQVGAWTTITLHAPA